MKTKSTIEKLCPGKVYHVYNRAVGDEVLFRTDHCFFHFISKLKKFVLPVVRIYAYCLLPNHFHLLVQIRQADELVDLFGSYQKIRLTEKVNQCFSNFFNSFAVSTNRMFSRKGKLFMLPYKRILVDDETYLKHLVHYVHRNPIHHGLVNDYATWPFSTYKFYTCELNSFIETGNILELFGGIEEFKRFHSDLTGQINLLGQER
jgi:REP element-mobilizing transposase RayT